MVVELLPLLSRKNDDAPQERDVQQAGQRQIIGIHTRFV